MIKNHKSAGFTMIEMLVSIAIVITCATIVVAIITATFRTSNNTSTQEKLRQEGTSALSQVTTMIRLADSFNGVVGTDGTPIPSCQNLSSDSSISVQSVSITSRSVGHVVACLEDGSLGIDGQPLTDSNSIKSTCDMTCTQNTSADPPVITINLSLSNFSSNSDSLQENSSSITDLSQSVRMNNLNQ